MALVFILRMVLNFVKDTLKSPPPENKVMKKVSFYTILGTAIFYCSLGFIGYAAFGSDAPGNILTGFDEPVWLVDVGNIAVIIHLIGGYQVLSLSLCELSVSMNI